jgi:glycosyltransferase involved in cell wall biosynthesis
MSGRIAPVQEAARLAQKPTIDGLGVNAEESRASVEADGRDLAMVLRRYGFLGLDVNAGGASVTRRLRLFHPAREALSLSTETVSVIFVDQPNVAGLDGLCLKGEPAGGFLYAPRETWFARRLLCYRSLLPHVSFSGKGVRPIWVTKSGRTVIGWWERNGTRHLLIGLRVAEEIVKYTQGNPNKVVFVKDKTMWGLPGHERPTYLFEDNIVRGHEMVPWADRLGYLLARLLAGASGLPLIGPLPKGAKGAVLLTGDDDQAFLEKYDEQLALLAGFPISYFMLPHTRHTPETLARMPDSVEYGVHIDALPDPGAYEEICKKQTDAVRELTGRPLRSVRNHGHLNRGYWGHLPAWEECGLTFDLNIRGIDGTCCTSSYLPFRVRRQDGSWSSHIALFSTFSDSMFYMQHWQTQQQIVCVTGLADQIEAVDPGVIVLNLHPQNVGDFHHLHQTVMALGRREGWVALGVQSYLDWLEALDQIRLIDTGDRIELRSAVRIEGLSYSWPGGREPRTPHVLPPWQGAIALEPMPTIGNPPSGSQSPEAGPLVLRGGAAGLSSLPEAGLADALRLVAADGQNAILPAELQKKNTWYSWDPKPWAHPWLTPANLTAAKAFNNMTLRRVVARYGGEFSRNRRYAFVGNLANNMAMRALPLRRRGFSIDLLLHPHDRYVMSQPGWEISEATLPEGQTNIDHLRELGIHLPTVPGCFTPPLIDQIELSRIVALAMSTPSDSWPNAHVPSFLRQSDILLWPAYMAFLPFLDAEQTYDAIFAAAAPYLAYLSKKPYLAAQTGGDLWVEGSRGDALGTLQRRAYGNAAAILATNPWAYSNARRFGFRNVLYVPIIVDTDAYAPGPATVRERWQAQVGGEFFALVTARIDRRWKGSHIGIEGFARFAEQNPQARLVLVGWGDDSVADIDDLVRRGLEGRFVRLPISGKRKLVEYLRAADCLIDQFVIGYYGGTALEAMSSGTPVIMHLLREQYDALCPTGAPPILNAATAQEVAAQLGRLAASSDTRREFSTASRRWIEENHSVDIWGESYGALLNAVASGERIRFDESPLASPLTAEERDYHTAGLAAAPTFPDYLT